jgi:hypothetical protein
MADHTCECCRIALALDSEGRVRAMWRNVFPGQIRDHALAVLSADAGENVEPLRATFSNWHVEACPEHGPALAITRDGVRHMAWFSVVDGRADVYYSRLAANGHPLGEPSAFGATGKPGEQASHAALLENGGTLWLAWKDFDGDTMRVLLRRSDDEGQHWSASRTLAQTAGGSDNPQLLADAGRVYLSWRTQDDGYMLLPADGEKKMKQLIVLMLALPLLFGVVSARAVADLQPLVAADVERMLAAEPGQARIVGIWSLDCSYCRENIGRIAKWQKKHREARVTMIAMDSLDDNEPALTQVLAAMPLPPQAAQYANAEAIPEKLRRALDPDWRGELPRTMLIDAHGVRQSHSGLLAPRARCVAPLGDIDVPKHIGF